MTSSVMDPQAAGRQRLLVSFNKERPSSSFRLLMVNVEDRRAVHDVSIFRSSVITNARMAKQSNVLVNTECLGRKEHS